MLISFIFIAKVKGRSRELIENKRFKEYNTEAEIALGDILYLPQEFESDDNEEDFWKVSLVVISITNMKLLLFQLSRPYLNNIQIIIIKHYNNFLI